MTLVPSRLRPSNGNRYFILLLIFLISSCATKKIAGTKNAEVIPITPKKPKNAQVQEDSIKKKTTPFDIDNGNVPSKTPKVSKNDVNSIYNVAVILPLYLDQIPLGYYADDSTKQLNTDSRTALAFYTGCQMAHEKFESSKLNMNVYFVDDKNDSATMVSLFKRKPFPNVDYIVGPATSKNLQLATDLSKRSQVPLISPVENSLYIKDNPYFFSAFPSLKTQYAYLLEKIKAKFPNKTLEVIYDGQDASAESITILKEMESDYYKSGMVKYTSLHSGDDIAEKMTIADTTSDRVILIYSSKETYVKPVIAKLKPVKNELYIFTSSVSKNIKALADTKYPHTIYTSYPFNTETPNFSALSLKFEEKSKRKPDELVAQGYDVMMHLFNMLESRQNLQDNSHSNSIDFDNTQGKFIFKPILNKSGGIDYYDNTFLYLYTFVNGTFVISTP
jgi:ABC-type branched-subunit amino acid transport system substrate-binding protein